MSYFTKLSPYFGSKDRLLTPGIKAMELKDVSRKDCDFIFNGKESTIIIEIKEFLTKSSLAIRLRLDFEHNHTVVRPKVCADYGYGYEEDQSFRLTPLSADSWFAVFVFPGLLRRLRIDMTDVPAEARILKIGAERAPIASLLNDLIEVPGYLAGGANLEFQSQLTSALTSRRGALEGDDEGKMHALGAAGATKALNETHAVRGQVDWNYLQWYVRNDTPSLGRRAELREAAARLARRPLLSVVMPAYDPPIAYFRQAIESVLRQTYDHLELCIADDASLDEEVRAVVLEYARTDPRVRYVFRRENGHISHCTNSALALATGDFVVLMDNDDLLPAHALSTIAEFIDRHPNAEILFSDEDKITVDGLRLDPYFKGDFDRFLLYGHNMVSHLGIYKRSLVEAVGGFRPGFEGSQDYDLTLRCLERCGEDRIVHIPHVLYHWRMIPGSTAISADQKDYAFEAAKRAINEHFARCNYPLVSIDGLAPGISAVRTKRVRDPGRISIVIPTRDQAGLLRACVASIERSGDPLVEIVIVDNRSSEPETHDLFAELRDYGNVTIVAWDKDFNFSELCNAGAAQATGDILCFLNNDTEVDAPTSFSRARTWLSLPEIGVVGARLLYPERHVQHFGIYVGTGPHGIATAPHVGRGEFEHAYFSKSLLLQQFTAVTAACLFVRRSDFETLGRFDTGLAVAYNDVDLCLKYRSAGYKIICDPDITVIHKESQSRGLDVTDEKRARLDREAAYMVRKWGDIAAMETFYNPNFSRTDLHFKLEAPSPGG